MEKLTDFERGLLFGWTCQAELPTEIRKIINKVCKPQEQFDSMYEGNNIQEFFSQANLPVRTYRILDSDGYETLDHLLSQTDGELLKSPNFGRKSLNELLYAYKRFGLVGRRERLIAERKGK